MILLRQAHALQEGRETRIGANRIVAGISFDVLNERAVFRRGFFQPWKGFVFVSGDGVVGGDQSRVYVGGARLLLLCLGHSPDGGDATGVAKFLHYCIERRSVRRRVVVQMNEFLPLV